MPSDYIAVKALKYELYRSMAEAIPNIHTLPDPEASFFSEEAYCQDLTAKSQVYLIATASQNDNIVGYVSVGKRVQPHNSLFVPKAYANIDEVFVHEEYRRLGVARALVQATFRWAKENNLQTVKTGVYAQNEGGVGFWNKVGFEPYKILAEHNLPK